MSKHPTNKGYSHTLWDFIFPRPINIRRIKHLPRSIKVPRETLGKELIDALFNYQNKEVKTLITYLKRNNDYGIAREVAKLMYRRLWHYGEYQQQSITIIPVPISRKTKKERGYNQTSNIAKIFAQHINGIVIPPSHLTKRDTEKQALLPKEKRKGNVHNAFSVQNTTYIKNKHCIVIDDLTTTGATMNEVFRVLIKSGAASVKGLCIARA